MSTPVEHNTTALEELLLAAENLPYGSSGGAINYGTENAGKLLYVGADGYATVLTLGIGFAIVNGVLTLTNAQASAAICGAAICGNTICGGN
jgi:hypothetical protein